MSSRSVARYWFALLLLVAAPAALAEVEVSIDRNPVQVNESFQLVFSLDRSPDHPPDFAPLQQHFIVLANNRSSSISIINGEYQRSIKWTLQLMAKKVGEFVIPPIRFDDESSQPLKVTVKKSTLSAVPDDELVLEALTDKSEAFVQSQVVLTLRLLSAGGISAYQFGQVRVGNIDTVVEALGDERQYQTRIAGRQYLVLERQYALFPQQSGRLEIEPVMAEVRQSRTKFDPFQGGGEIRRLRSPAVTVDVKPIPAEFQGSYWLPARRLQLRQEWQGDLGALVAGEPVTRSLTLVADGLTAAQLPEIEFAAIDGIKQYPDQPVLDNSRVDQGIRGRRVQKVALIPGAAGSYRVPEIRIPWWNLERDKMEVAVLPGRELMVAPAAAPAPGAPVAVPETEPVPAPAPAAAPPAAGGSRFWPVLSLLLACGWALSAAWWWYRSHRAAPVTAAAAETASLRSARRELLRACAGDDAAAARAALLAWGQALLAPQRIANLQRLGDLLGPELAAEIDRLNASLYASARREWRGAGLAELCRRLETETGAHRRERPALLPLNPAA